MLVEEDGLGLLEGHTVLPSIGRGLPRIPREAQLTHPYSVNTAWLQCKPPSTSGLGADIDAAHVVWDAGDGRCEPVRQVG